MEAQSHPATPTAPVPQQVAQATPAAAAIGTVNKLAGMVTATHKDGTLVTLKPGDTVYQGDILQTSDGASVGLVLADGTELSLGSKGHLALDEMVYDPATGEGEASVSLVSGVFSFVSGQIAKSSPDGMQIKTPVATIGIRGTSGTVQIGDLALNDDSQIRVVLIPDPSGTVGEIQVTTLDGRTSVLNGAFNGLNIGQSTFQTFTISAKDFVSQYGSVINSLRSDFSSTLGTSTNDHNNSAPQQNNTPSDSNQGDGQGAGQGGNPNGTQDQSSNSTQNTTTAQNQGTEAVIKVVLSDAVVEKSSSSALQNSSSGLDGIGGAGRNASNAQSSTSTSTSFSTSSQTSHSSSTDNSLNSGSTTTATTTTTTTTTSTSHSGTVIDPYVSGATVFIDYDGDTILDGNEPFAITKADGSYTLTDTLKLGGQVVSIGGVDIETGLAMGTLTAPSGSSSVTPLTTLMQNLISAGTASSAAQAQSLVAAALGLNVNGIDLTTYDPIANLSSSSSSQASLLLSTGVMVQNVISMISATLVGAGASEAGAAEAAFNALAAALNSASDRSFLQDARALTSIISNAASDSAVSGSVDSGKVAAAQSAVAQTISSLSAAMENIISSGGSAEALLSNLSAAARVAQRDAQADIATAVADGTSSSLTSAYSASAISALIAQVKTETVSTAGPIEGTSGDDVLRGTDAADEIYGYDGNDTLFGNAGNDRLYGGNGNDTLIGGAGNDSLSGGAGIDTVSYAATTAGVVVSLAAGTASGSEIGSDSLSSIEVVLGGSGNDTFTGSSNADTLIGNAGDDTFIGSAGADVLNGGAGTDTVSYAATTAGVVVSLAAGTASGSEIGSDSLSSIEVVLGGSGNDTFTGSSNADTLIGNAGDDTLMGGGGADILNGGVGNDTLTYTGSEVSIIGGEGIDRLLIASGSSVSLSSLSGVVSGVEIFDLGTSATTLSLTAADVSGLISGDWFIIEGSSAASLSLSESWVSGDEVIVNDVGYDSYSYDGVQILVSHDIAVTLPEVEQPGTANPGIIYTGLNSAVLVGDYIHLGITGAGYLGAPSSLLAGSDWSTKYGALTLVSDTDGFGMGTASPSGDYFMPGTPINGFSLGYDTSSTGGSRVVNVAHYDHAWDFSAAVTSATVSGSLMTATSTSTADALDVSQVITLESDATYYTTTVTVTNHSDATLYSVRYMQNSDPDMDLDSHGTYDSVNDVLANPSDSGVAAVQALGGHGGDAIVYFSDDTAARASANGFENSDPYANAVYTSPTDPNGASGDIGINLVIDAGDIAAGQSATVTFITSLNVASEGKDYLVGTSGSDVLDALGGNDTLWGLGGGDTLNGGAGNDVLIGGAGNDGLTGGDGQDVFSFTGGVGSTVASRLSFLGTDIITDFTGGSDSLLLDGETFSISGALDYAESTNALSSSAQSFGDGGSGVIVVGADSGNSGVEVWFTTDSSAVTTSNSYQIATLAGVDLSTISASDIHTS